MNSSRTTLFVGNLPNDTCKAEVENMFSQFGPIGVDLKIPSAYAFIKFETARDAHAAIDHFDGIYFDDRRSWMELPRVTRRTNYQVQVLGLPASATWHQLKEHMSKAGDVCHSEIIRDRNGLTMGIVDYDNPEDMAYAIEYLTDGVFVDPSTKLESVIDVTEYKPIRSRSYSRSRSPSRSQSRERSRSRNRNISPKPKPSRRSPAKSGFRPRSGSKSRSKLSISPKPKPSRRSPAGFRPRSGSKPQSNSSSNLEIGIIYRSRAK